jgi:hypothetical protein
MGSKPFCVSQIAHMSSAALFSYVQAWQHHAILDSPALAQTEPSNKYYLLHNNQQTRLGERGCKRGEIAEERTRRLIVRSGEGRREMQLNSVKGHGVR